MTEPLNQATAFLLSHHPTASIYFLFFIWGFCKAWGTHRQKNQVAGGKGKYFRKSV